MSSTGGRAVLAAYAEAAGFPLVTSNVDASAEPALAGRLRPGSYWNGAGSRSGSSG